MSDAIAEALRPIIARELSPLLERIATLESKLLAATAQAADGSRLLSLRDIGKRYNVGRIQATRDIKSGRLHVVERRCRGGRLGVFATVEACEALYAGANR